MDKIITFSGEKFSELLSLKAKASALAKEIKSIQDSMELPIPTIQTQGVWIIKDGNGQVRGKYTVSWRNPETIPRAGIWAGRLS